VQPHDDRVDGELGWVGVGQGERCHAWTPSVCGQVCRRA